MDREEIEAVIRKIKQELPYLEEGSCFNLVGINKGDFKRVGNITVEKYDSIRDDISGYYKEVIYKVINSKTKEYCFISFTDHWDWVKEFEFVEPKQVIKTTWDKCDFNPMKSSENKNE